LDLARDVIRFYGLEPDVDIPIVYTGVRPGEKLFEELLTAEEGTERTEYERLLVARLEEPCAGWRDQLDRLVRAAHAEDEAQVRAALADLVPTHNLNAPRSGPPDAGS
jgi:FlaA1/EpsC-like NDP-sugar epimerase